MSWMPGEYREIAQIRWCAKKYFSWIVFSSWDILLPWQGWQKWPPFTSNWESVPPLLILVYKFQSWSVRIGEIYSNSEHISSIWPYRARQENHQTSRQYFQICSLCSNAFAYSNCRTKWSSLLLQPLLTHFPRARGDRICGHGCCCWKESDELINYSEISGGVEFVSVARTSLVSPQMMRWI